MSNRIPSLDGLRAVSIMMVLFGHLAGTAGAPAASLASGWGELGVRIFFVTSGFLITSLLLKELERSGNVSLRTFYFRRTMRIVPGMYVFVAVVTVLAALHVLGGPTEADRVQLRQADVIASATFTMNFQTHHSWWLGHTWSLGVEEQFYVLWPVALASLGTAGGLRIAVGAIVAAPLLRTAFYYGWPAQRPLVDQAFPFVFDALATGCVLAMLRRRLWDDRRYRALLESPLFVLVPIATVLTYAASPLVGPTLLVGRTLTQAGIAMCIDWAMRFPLSGVGTFLNSRPIRWVGTISYSLFLWQQLFLCRYHPAWFTAFPLNIVLAFLAATASYYLVEQPFLRLRQRLEGRSPRATAAVAAAE